MSMASNQAQPILTYLGSACSQKAEVKSGEPVELLKLLALLLHRFFLILPMILILLAYV